MLQYLLKSKDFNLTNKRLQKGNKLYSTDVLVIGAGPSGSVVGSLLHQNGLDVLVVEKQYFPRFVIGESLLPFCMHALQKANLLDAVFRNQETLGFQFKNGAAFCRGSSLENLQYHYFDFCDKSSEGFGTTFQVKRALFDKLLIDTAIENGIKAEFGVGAASFDMQKDDNGYVSVVLEDGRVIKTKFIIDASGYGRVMSKALDLEQKSSLPSRRAIFTHIQDGITELLYDRKKILITTHPVFNDVWFWLIPFSDGTCSIGVVGEDKYLFDSRFCKQNELLDSMNLKEILQAHIQATPIFQRLLNQAKYPNEVRTIEGYSASIKQFFGESFAILGNAGEFLDPVFSSGVTIAVHAGVLLAPLVARKLNGEKIDFQDEYVKPLEVGIEAFRTYVEGWYNLKFQEVIYAPKKEHNLERQICSILAGYAWDSNNPFVTKSQRALQALYEKCKS